MWPSFDHPSQRFWIVMFTVRLSVRFVTGSCQPHSQPCTEIHMLPWSGVQCSAVWVLCMPRRVQYIRGGIIDEPRLSGSLPGGRRRESIVENDGAIGFFVKGCFWMSAKFHGQVGPVGLRYEQGQKSLKGLWGLELDVRYHLKKNCADWGGEVSHWTTMNRRLSHTFRILRLCLLPRAERVAELTSATSTIHEHHWQAEPTPSKCQIATKFCIQPHSDIEEQNPTCPQLWDEQKRGQSRGK